MAVDRPVTPEEAEQAVVHELTHWILAPLDVSAAKLFASDVFPNELRDVLSEEWEDTVEALVWRLTPLFRRAAEDGVWVGEATDDLIAPLMRLTEKLEKALAQEHGAAGVLLGEVLRIRADETEKALKASIDNLLGWAGQV